MRSNSASIRENGLAARSKRRFKITTDSEHHDDPMAPNILNQDFSVENVNECGSVKKIVRFYFGASYGAVN